MRLMEFTVALIVFLAAGNASAVGFSAGPLNIMLDNLRAGQTVSKTLVLGGDDTVSLNMTPKAVGDIESWVTFEGGGNLTLGEDNFFILSPGEHRINALFLVPSDAPDGNYSGNILFEASPLETSGNGVEVSLASTVSLHVFANVTSEQVLSLKVSGVTLASEYDADTPINYSVNFLNNGNAGALATVKSTVLDESMLNIVSSREDEVEVGLNAGNQFNIPLTEEGFVDGIYHVTLDVESRGASLFSSFKSIKVGTGVSPEPKPKPATPDSVEKQEKSSMWLIILGLLIVLAYYARRKGVFKPKSPGGGLNQTI